MAKITLSILQKIAPQTSVLALGRFLLYLNEALPRYGIVSELQVAGFLATAAFESQYFQKTKEGRARSTSSVWIKYQSKYWATNYMGRGIFQTTHLKNYRTFGQKMKEKGLVTDSEMFVKNPALLEQPSWAIESACEYWETNGLDKYAKQGFKGFSALQGRVNTGSAEKVAHDYPNRLLVYERARLALPDDFTLDLTHSAASQSAINPASNQPDNGTAEIDRDDPVVKAKMPPILPIDEPPTPPEADDQTIVSVPPVVTEKPVSLVNKIQNWYATLPAFLLALIGGFWSWLQGAATEIIIAFLVSAGAVVAVFIFTNHSSRNKDKQRDFEADQKQKDRDFQLTMLQLQSAMDPNKQTVRVSPPSVLVPDVASPANN